MCSGWNPTQQDEALKDVTSVPSEKNQGIGRSELLVCYMCASSEECLHLQFYS